MLWCVSSLVAVTTRRRSSVDSAKQAYYLLATGRKKVLSVWRVHLKWGRISHFRRNDSFIAHASPDFQSALLGVTAFFRYIFILFILFTPKDYSLNILSDKNYLASSQKFREITSLIYCFLGCYFFFFNQGTWFVRIVKVHNGHVVSPDIIYVVYNMYSIQRDQVSSRILYSQVWFQFLKNRLRIVISCAYVIMNRKK